MATKSVKFGKRNALEIIDPNAKKQVFADIASKIDGMAHNDKNYWVLRPNNLYNLKKNPHQVGLYTYGKKFWLFLTRIKVGTADIAPYTLFIDKKRDMIVSLPLKFHNDLYQGGTLIDGDWIKTDDTWLFQMSDLYLYRGEFLKPLSLDNRLAKLRQIVTDLFSPGDHDLCRFEVIQYFPYKNISDLATTYRQGLNYKCSGLIFKNSARLEKAYLFIFPECNTPEPRKDIEVKTETKPLTEEEASFVPLDEDGVADDSKKVVRELWVRTTEYPDVYLLSETKEPFNKIGYAHIPTLELSTAMKQLFERENGETAWIQCEWHPRFKKWQPLL